MSIKKDNKSVFKIPNGDLYTQKIYVGDELVFGRTTPQSPYMDISYSGNVTASIVDGYKILEFNNIKGTPVSDGTLTINSFGTLYNSFEILMVAGGGGGGHRAGGGGGAGELYYSASVIFPSSLVGVSGSYDIRVGHGGSGSVTDSVRGNNGGNSQIASVHPQFTDIVVLGGGGGGSCCSSPAINGSDGGSGGGGQSGGSGTGGSAIGSFEGNVGGNGTGGGRTAGGGGGAGAVGANGGPYGGTTDGYGGDGLIINHLITGIPTYYAGGGGGGNDTGPGGSGGAGGGGTGGTNGVDATDGTDGLGGGGGGQTGFFNAAAGRGGDGVVFIKFRFAS